ncbi:MAG: alpha-glucosidase C-terminal domain-containing protein, partial [Thiolinea sp.]
REQPALLHGSLSFVDAPESVVALMREHDGKRLFCAFNLADTPCRFDSGHAGLQALEGHPFTTTCQDGVLELPAFGAFFGTL